MKLTVFQSDKGDCLLLTGADGRHVLVDGGMSDSYTKHVSPALELLRKGGEALEVVYVSHIDQDHISGVLQLLEDEAEWRAFDHHQRRGDTVKRPAVPRPPVIKGIFHNAFRDQVEGNTGSIRSLLAASAASLLQTGVPSLAHPAEEMEKIATSIPEALRVSQLAAGDALDIPLNQPPGSTDPAKLMFAGQGVQSFDVGSMRFTLIGPTEAELEKLRDGWQKWLQVEKNRTTVKNIRTEIKRRIDDFSAGALGETPFDLGSWNGIPDHEGVTVPNIASLMFMVQEKRKRLLLTGDSHQDFILAGLQRTGFMPRGYVHLDVLKVQHHGAAHNMNTDFAQRVSADHYVFCGNGEYGNPEPEVIDLVYQSRTGGPNVRAKSRKARNRPFHFWFSTEAGWEPASEKAAKNFRELKAHVQTLQAASGGLLQLHFNDAVSSVLEI